jgi:pyridoxal phosphate enzyme (YggS family)
VAAVASRYETVRRQVAHAADIAGRSPDEITIVAVTKTVGIDDIRSALTAGISDFGENRVQEFLGKYGLFPDASWHFIGTLQTNKVKDVVGRACLIHSVDSLHLLEEIGKRAQAAGLVQRVLLQVNVSGEGSKHGFDCSDVREALIEASHLPNVEVRGLMTMAPFGRPEDARWVFRELRELRDSLREMPLNSVELNELSMGMSNDFRVAVEEGSTIVRVGGAIFGR